MKILPYCTHCGKELSDDAKFCPDCGTPVQSPTITEPPPPPLELEKGVILADWGERFIAWLIDVIIVGVISGLLNLPGLQIHPLLFFVTFGSRDVVQFLYWTLIEGITGQSIGKMIMRLKVTKTDGSSATLLEAAIESFGKAFLLPLDCIIGWLAESCKAKNQRVFNMISNTIVIRVSRERDA